MIVSRKEYSAFFLGIAMIALPFFALQSIPAFAQTEVEKLRDQIDERNDRLAEIEKEIAQYKADLQKVGAEKSTLQNAINQLELERKKVQADINYTEQKIKATDLEINKLSYEIDSTEASIAKNKNAIGEILRRIRESDDYSLIETLLQTENVSEFWDVVEELKSVQHVMGEQVQDLALYQSLLENQVSDQTNKRGELLDLKEQYSAQNSILSDKKQEKDTLLSRTKNEEAEYQRLLQEREAAREQLVKELRDFESKLQFILDPNTIPSAGSAVFNWPLDSVIITQLFGGTEFAKANASVYAGRAYHPGVDFGAAVGTPIKAPLSGTVRATGNTDLVPGCYSWGKWTLIDHANGLSTLYAHQSAQNVSEGQSVSTGDVIGYTGNTGYTTGPHLHFTVYAKAGVTVRDFGEIKASTNCAGAKTPTAATEAYIDPMQYLPAY